MEPQKRLSEAPEVFFRRPSPVNTSTTEHHRTEMIGGTDSMTQDCVGWDESKNLDLRKLADPTFQTPRNHGDETPVSSSTESDRTKNTTTTSKTKVHPRRPSLDAVTRHLQQNVSTASTVQEIQNIFHQIGNGQQPLMNADGDSLTPVQNNTTASSLRSTTVSGTAGVFAVAGSRKRQRREQPKPALVARTVPEQKKRTNNNIPARLPQPPQAVLATGNSTEFDDLLHQIQSPPGDRKEPLQTRTNNHVVPPLQKPRQIVQNPLVPPQSASMLPQRQPKNRYQQPPQQRQQHNNSYNRSKPATTSQQARAIQQPKPIRTHEKQTIHANQATATIVDHQPPRQGVHNVTSSNDDEFGDLEFSVDDFATIDSLVGVASQQQQQVSANSRPQENARPPAAATTVTAGDQGQPKEPHQTKEPIECPQNSVTKEEDPFDDFPDIDFDALDKAVQAKVPTQQQQQQQQQHRTAKNEDDPFGDFSDVDFDALDKVVEARTTSSQSNTQQQQTAAMPPQNAPVRNPRRLRAIETNEPSFLTFSRYKVLRVDVDLSTFTKTLTVASWTAEMLKVDEESSKAYHSHSDASGRVRDPSSDKVWSAAGLIHLRGEWYHTRVMDGDNIHICSLTGQFRTDETVLPLILHTCPPSGSDSDDLVMIVHPDMLLTPTIISETVSCTRRAILKNRLGSTGLSSRAAVFGTMRHELFEETMKTQDFSSNSAVAHIQNITKQHAEDLFSCRISSSEAEEEIIKVLPQLQQFANEYTEFGQVRGPRTIDQSAVLENQGAQLPTNFVAKEAEAIEEPVISPELGLKGNVDMLVQAMTATNDPNPNVGQQVSISFMGVELKTGHNQRPQNAHIAQLALYILMMQTRYGIRWSNAGALTAAKSGVLLYMNNEAVRAVHIAPIMSEIKSLIGQRNVVATEQLRAARPRGVRLSYEEDFTTAKKIARFELLEPPPVDLPDLLSNSHSCKKCYSNRECMMYAAGARSAQKITVAESSHEELMRHFTGHLRDDDYAYFTEWDRLVDLEAHAHESLVATAWLLGADEREAETSKSVSSLVYEPTSSSPEAVFDETWYAVIGFGRSPSAAIQKPLSNIGFAPGCRVIVSTDSTTLQETRPHSSRRSRVVRPKLHIVRGVVHAVTDTKLSVRASRDDLVRIQKIVKASDGDQERFRLDRDDSATGIGTLRQNLINLFTADIKPPEEHDTTTQQTRLSRLRDFIIRLREPVYDRSLVKSMFLPSTESPSTVPGCDMTDLVVEYEDMNPDQRAAVEKVIASKDYTLIQGLPGTGKTSTIAFVARLLAARGQRVLITSYTHAAVDNVLLKLIEKGVASTNESTQSSALLRVGRKSSCHPGVHSILANSIAVGFESNSGTVKTECAFPSAESLRQAVSSARIVGVTALTVPRSPLLVGEQFDVVILDEAGQISQPATLGALMAANTFVLCGDHMQLPPLVVSELAGKGDFGVSMLKRLAEKHPDSVAQLTYQYRMHEDICQLSNDIVYKGKLKCADESVAKKKLPLAGFPENLPRVVNGKSTAWLDQTLDPASAVVFLDTDAIKDTALNNVAPGSIQVLERSAGREVGGSIVNDTEIVLVRTVVSGLLACGMDASSIGLICPFRAQLRMLEECPTLSRWKSCGLEMSTIDRYQGRDKDVIVLSFVRSNSKGKVGRLLSDFRRLNVAVTRAKCKLIMIGSYSTLHSGSDVLKPVLERVRGRGGVFQLPENATQCYSSRKL